MTSVDGCYGRDALIADIPRDGITCDVCDRPNPAHQCQKCFTVYYCSSDCLRQLGNKHDCHDIIKMRNSLAGIGQSLDISQAKNNECGICLESLASEENDKHQNPIVVLAGCRHAFCCKCLQRWHTMEKLKVDCTCPMCRTPTQNTSDDSHEPMETAKLYGARAKKDGISNQQRQEYCNKALEELDKVLAPAGVSDGNNGNLQALFTKAEILLIQSRPRDALEVIELIYSIDSKNRKKHQKVSGYLDQVQVAMEAGNEEEQERLMAIVEDIAGSRGEHIGKVMNSLMDVLLMKGEAHEALGEWEVAKEIYKDLLGLGSGIPRWVSTMILSLIAFLFTHVFGFGGGDGSITLLIRQATKTIMGASMVYGIVQWLWRSYIPSSSSSSSSLQVLMIPVELRTPSVTQQRHCYMRLIRCYYELGDYNRALMAGDCAIQMNRHYPGVYEYVAKAHLAKGNQKEALQTMQRAVLYETPWDVTNIAQQLKLLQEVSQKA